MFRRKSSRDDQISKFPKYQQSNEPELVIKKTNDSPGHVTTPDVNSPRNKYLERISSHAFGRPWGKSKTPRGNKTNTKFSLDNADQDDNDNSSKLKNQDNTLFLVDNVGYKTSDAACLSRNITCLNPNTSCSNTDAVCLTTNQVCSITNQVCPNQYETITPIEQLPNNNNFQLHDMSVNSTNKKELIPPLCSNKKSETPPNTIFNQNKPLRSIMKTGSHDDKKKTPPIPKSKQYKINDITDESCYQNDGCDYDHNKPLSSNLNVNEEKCVKYNTTANEIQYNDDWTADNQVLTSSYSFSDESSLPIKLHNEIPKMNSSIKDTNNSSAIKNTNSSAIKNTNSSAIKNTNSSAIKNTNSNNTSNKTVHVDNDAVQCYAVDIQQTDYDRVIFFLLTNDFDTNSVNKDVFRRRLQSDRNLGFNNDQGGCRIKNIMFVNENNDRNIYALMTVMIDSRPWETSNGYHTLRLIEYLPSKIYRHNRFLIQALLEYISVLASEYGCVKILVHVMNDELHNFLKTNKI